MLALQRTVDVKAEIQDKEGSEASDTSDIRYPIQDTIDHVKAKLQDVERRLVSRRDSP